MIVYKEESYKVVGAAFKVYNGLGRMLTGLRSIITFMPQAISWGFCLISDALTN